MSDEIIRPGTGIGGDAPRSPEDRKLIEAAFAGDIAAVRAALQKGASVDAVDDRTGLCALHIAVGSNDSALARLLIEEAGAGFFADRFGRWPSLIAAECRVDEALGDFIAEAEARAVMKATGIH